jgi:Raf kinase inhibitor-like YbhB/YbcL family protein
MFKWNIGHVITWRHIMNVFDLTSSAFKNGENLPTEHTCAGRGISPPLSWKGTPPGTKSLVIVCEDPDAPAGLFTHWILYNMPSAAIGVPPGVPRQPVLVDGSRHGMNNFGRMEYGAPCPPPGKPHRYIFRLYALDTVLALNAPVTRDVLNKASSGHILAQTELLSRFSR